MALFLPPGTEPYSKEMVSHCKLCEAHATHADTTLLASKAKSVTKQLAASSPSDVSKCTVIPVICINMHVFSEGEKGMIYVLFIITALLW